MNLNHPVFYFGIAVLAAVGVSLVNVASEKKGPERWKHVKLAISPFLIVLSAWGAWQGQERITQRWNSQVIFEASADKQKNLILKNLGQVEIEDVRIYATVYRMKVHYDKAHHVIIDGIKDFSKIGEGAFGGALAEIPLIAPGDSKTVGLAEEQLGSE